MLKHSRKEKWSMPKLTILTRGRKQERILAYCKYSGQMPVSNENWHAGCDFMMYDQQGHGVGCRDCSMRFSS